MTMIHFRQAIAKWWVLILFPVITYSFCCFYHLSDTMGMGGFGFVGGLHVFNNRKVKDCKDGGTA